MTMRQSICGQRQMRTQRLDAAAEIELQVTISAKDGDLRRLEHPNDRRLQTHENAGRNQAGAKPAAHAPVATTRAAA